MVRGPEALHELSKIQVPVLHIPSPLLEVWRVRSRRAWSSPTVTVPESAELGEAVLYPQPQADPLPLRRNGRKPKTAVKFIRCYFKSCVSWLVFFPTSTWGFQKKASKAQGDVPWGHHSDTVLISSHFIKDHMAGLEASWNLVCIKVFLGLKCLGTAALERRRLYLHSAWQMSYLTCACKEWQGLHNLC